MDLDPEFFDVPLHFRRSPRSHRNHRIGFANSSAPRNPTRFFPRLSPRTPYLLSLQLDLWSHLTSRGWMTPEDHKRHQRVHPGVCYAPNGRRSLEGTRVRLVELKISPDAIILPLEASGSFVLVQQKNLGRLHGPAIVEWIRRWSRDRVDGVRPRVDDPLSRRRIAQVEEYENNMGAARGNRRGSMSSSSSSSSTTSTWLDVPPPSPVSGGSAFGGSPCGVSPTICSPHDRATPAHHHGICKVCFDRPYDTLILPCKHISMCGGCAQAVDKCPVCRGAKEVVVKVYLT